MLTTQTETIVLHTCVSCMSYPASSSTANITQLSSCWHTAQRLVMTYIMFGVCRADSFWYVATCSCTANGWQCQCLGNINTARSWCWYLLAWLVVIVNFLNTEWIWMYRDWSSMDWYFKTSRGKCRKKWQSSVLVAIM